MWISDIVGAMTTSVPVAACGVDRPWVAVSVAFPGGQVLHSVVQDAGLERWARLAEENRRLVVMAHPVSDIGDVTF